MKIFGFEHREEKYGLYEFKQDFDRYKEVSVLHAVA